MSKGSVGALAVVELDILHSIHLHPRPLLLNVAMQPLYLPQSPGMVPPGPDVLDAFHDASALEGRDTFTSYRDEDCPVVRQDLQGSSEPLHRGYEPRQDHLCRRLFALDAGKEEPGGIVHDV